MFFVSDVGQAESHRVMTFSNEEDVVFFRHHMYEKKGGKEVVLHEVGPRFEMQLYQLRLGTLDQVIPSGKGVCHNAAVLKDSVPCLCECYMRTNSFLGHLCAVFFRGKF